MMGFVEWDDRDLNPDALAGSKFSHRFGFRRHSDGAERRRDVRGPDCALTVRLLR
ncbi:MAG TPA: hypothetical protein VIW69_06475 [Candidatus Elarobacter sp.]